MTCCLYMMEAVGIGAFKVGTSSNLEARRHAIQSSSPVPITFCIVKELPSKLHARAWEEYIIANLCSAAHGEWFHDKQRGLYLVGGVAGKDVTGEFARTFKRWPRYRDGSETTLAEKLRQADSRMTVLSRPLMVAPVPSLPPLACGSPS